jgi:hypothetical protein
VFLIWHDIELSFQIEKPSLQVKGVYEEAVARKELGSGVVHTDQSQMLLLPSVDIQQDCKPCLI